MNKSIYEYANEKDNNKHISFYDVFSTLLKDIDCIICLESAADLLGYSNGGYREKISVYVTKEYNLPYLDCHIVKDLSKIKCDDYHGLKVTSIEKTIIDLLKNDKSDDQIMLETFANYYFENDSSYSKISPPRNLIKKFNYYKSEGEKYYDSY